MQSPLLYFTDAVLRGPTVGCMLMCLSAALIGVVVVLRKQSLLGEALSHAAYPGVVVGVIIAGFFGLRDENESSISFLIMFFAFLSALFGLFFINWLISKLKIKPDAALCFILSSLFGVGLTLASEVQFSHSSLYRQIQSYLYGQAATMTDHHIFVYGILSFACILAILLFYKEIQTISFDMDYAKSLGLKAKAVNVILFLLIALAVVIGIRSVGVVLMSAMLIAPAVAARQYTDKLSVMFLLAALFGMMSGFLGNYFSVEITAFLAESHKGERLILPTGPMIVISSAFICLFSLFFSPERGLILRLLRIGCFRYACITENLLKAIWRFSNSNQELAVSFDQVEKYQSLNPIYLRFLLFRLVANGFLEKIENDRYKLTKMGALKAEKIIRLHRLWEVYLANYLGVGIEKVHRNAEEMEHIITPEIEQELISLLKDPKEDPHHQPIPKKTN